MKNVLHMERLQESVRHLPSHAAQRRRMRGNTPECGGSAVVWVPL